MLETPQEILAHAASTDAVRGFIQWRKITKKPLTERAAGMIAKTLRDITGSGGDADEALDLAQEHGWQTIKAEWYWRIKNGGQSASTSGAKNTSAHSTTRAIIVAGSVRRTPSRNCF